MKKLILTSAAFAVGVLLSLPAHGDTITWEAATDTTSVADVSLNGTLVAAFNGGESDTTVAGVFFGASDLLTGSGVAAGFLAGATTGDDPFDVLLNEADFGGGSGTTALDLGSFTAGNLYEVQVFFTDQRAAQNSRVMTYGSSDSNGAGNSTVDLAADPNQDASTPFGQFAIGTFTADGDDPDLTLTPNGFGNSHFSAIQIRDVTPIPEPSSLAVLSVGVVGWIRRRRRKN